MMIGRFMKGLLTLSVIIGFTSMALAANLETAKMEAGVKFNEQVMEAKIDNNKVAPVQMNIELTEVKEAQYNAKAKDFSRLTAKAPATLIAKSDVEKKEDKTKKKNIHRYLMSAGIIVAVGVVAVAACSGGFFPLSIGLVALGCFFCGLVV